MPIHQSTPLKDIALNPGARNVLEQWKLDYLLRGESALSEACAEAGVPTDEVIESVTRASTAPVPADEPDWRAASVNEVVDHLLRVVHPAARAGLGALMHRATESREPRSQAALRRLRDALDELTCAERQALLEDVAALERARLCMGPWPDDSTSLCDRLEATVEAHERVIAALDELSGVAGERLAPALADLAATVRRQVHLERNVLVPRARDLAPVPSVRWPI